jgi:type IV secretory pathway VirD2 relaxase
MSSAQENLIQRLLAARLEPADGPEVRLPDRLAGEAAGARLGLIRRLALGRGVLAGDRRGVLSAAGRRSGRPFRLDLRQRVVVKALVSRHSGGGAVRAAALAKHAAYLMRPGAGRAGERPIAFDGARDGLDLGGEVRGWGADRHHFRFIVSPEHGERLPDLAAYVREVMGRVGADLGEPGLAWIGVCHFDTDQPHAHVLVRGRRADGRDLVIPRAYVAYGFRGRAQEVAQELLGDLTRQDAERRVWREVEARRFTGLDRRLMAGRDAEGFVDAQDGRAGAWSALTRGRLQRLQALGLAERVGSRFRLAEDLPARLRALELSGDRIRTLNQRRLAGAVAVQALGAAPVRGRVVAAGAHDELGAEPFVVVRDGAGTEHYARLGAGRAAPPLGADVRLAPGARGAQVERLRARGLDAGR